MNQTQDESTTGEPVQDESAPSLRDVALRLLAPIASLRLTIVLLSLSVALVFFGTLAQIEKDVWPVVDTYFRSLYVWIPIQLIAEFGKVFFELPPNTAWKGSFLFPGGWLIGGIMLVNLLAAHIVRFRFTWKRSGVLMIHSGIVVLMMGELITGLFAVESQMSLQLGETAGFIDITRRYELALVRSLDDKTNEVVGIPDDVLLDHVTKTIRDDKLPVDVEVLEYWKNTVAELNIVEDKKKNEKSTVFPAENGLIRFDGIYFKVVRAKEESGVESSKDNAAAFRVRLKKKGSDEVVGEFFVSLLQYRNFSNRMYYALPKSFAIDGTTYRILLRNLREEKPYALRMLKFEHELYARTTRPKEFASTIELFDPRTEEKRELRIHMNSPLRHDGVTFYQAGFVPDDSGTVLQVVRNPGWLLPYIACVVVSLGMLIHFGLHLNVFLKRRAVK